MTGPSTPSTDRSRVAVAPARSDRPATLVVGSSGGGRGMSSPVPPRPPTLDEVAERARVSRTVASRVINNGPHVSRAKRDAVEKAIRELGYTPNRAARALATRQTGVVVLAVSGDGPGVFADPFFGQIIVGACAALEKTDLHLVLSLATTGHGQRRLENFLQTRG